MNKKFYGLEIIIRTYFFQTGCVRQGCKAYMEIYFFVSKRTIVFYRFVNPRNI